MVGGIFEDFMGALKFVLEVRIKNSEKNSEILMKQVDGNIYENV